MKRICGKVRRTCPRHGVVNFFVYFIDDDNEAVECCELCLKEAEEYLLQDTA